MNPMVLYITAPSAQEANSIARALLEERLIACANVLDAAVSLYWWQGKIEQNAEAIVFAKTTSALAEQAIARVKALHSYECPCIVALPIHAGYPPFLDWIRAEASAISHADKG